MAEPKHNIRVVPIKQVDVYTAVRSKLVELLESGAYAPGARLPGERSLAEQLGVSRMAVREATKSLEATGRVSIVHGSGTFVTETGPSPLVHAITGGRPLDSSMLRGLVDLRVAIDSHVAYLAALHADAVGKANIVAALDRLESEQLSTIEEGSLDTSFEGALGAACGNDLLRELQAAVHEMWVQTWSNLGLAPGSKEGLHEEHQAILQAVLAGDGDAARRIVTEHVGHFSLDVLESVEPGSNGNPLRPDN